MLITTTNSKNQMDDGLSQQYLNQSLTYTEDGRLMDSDGNSVMMEWERPIMEKSVTLYDRFHSYNRMESNIRLFDSYIVILYVE